MIWKIYKVAVRTAVKCFTIALFNYDAALIRAQVDDLNRLNQLIKCVRQYYSTHPSLLQAYSSVEVYMEQHLSKEDWLLWVRLTVKNSVSTYQHQLQGA